MQQWISKIPLFCTKSTLKVDQFYSVASRNNCKPAKIIVAESPFWWITLKSAFEILKLLRVDHFYSVVSRTKVDQFSPVVDKIGETLQ